MLEQQIEQDLKAALLEGDRTRSETLRGLKSSLLYLKVEKGKRESGLSREEEIEVLSKESKKRAESAELYLKGGSEEKAKTELLEKQIIDKYLPKQLSEEELENFSSSAFFSNHSAWAIVLGKPSRMHSFLSVRLSKTRPRIDITSWSSNNSPDSILARLSPVTYKRIISPMEIKCMPC